MQANNQKTGFKRATRQAKFLREALIGPTGAGKTRTALEQAKAFGRIALIDSEHGSATMYSDFVDFDHLELNSFAPERYIEAIEDAERGGYDVLIIDSLSHAWAGKDGVLEFVDKKQGGGDANKFRAWGQATPILNRLVEKLLTCKLHLIVTLRSKMTHVMETDDKGKTIVKKIGLQPVMRDGIEFEFDVICDIDQDHTLKVTKTRIDEIDGLCIEKANEAFGQKLKAWLDAGGTPRSEPLTTKPEAAKDPSAKAKLPADPETVTKMAVSAELVRLGVLKPDQARAIRQMNLGTLPEKHADWMAILVDLKAIEKWEWATDEQPRPPSETSAPASAPSSDARPSTRSDDTEKHAAE